MIVICSVALSVKNSQLLVYEMLCGIFWRFVTHIIYILVP